MSRTPPQQTQLSFGSPLKNFLNPRMLMTPKQQRILVENQLADIPVLDLCEHSLAILASLLKLEDKKDTT